LQESLHKFKAALAAEPERELAMQYIDLTQSRLEVAADRTLVAWRKDFIEGDFVRAARDYHELLLRSSLDTIQEVHAEYRRVLSTFVDAWNRACAVNDAATMEEIRLRVNELLPESSFAEDLLAKNEHLYERRLHSDDRSAGAVAPAKSRGSAFSSSGRLTVKGSSFDCPHQGKSE
jgi:hypothetical protein